MSAIWRSYLAALAMVVGAAWQAEAGVVVVYAFSSNTNPTLLGPGVQSSSFNGSHLANYFIGNDGFGNVLEAYPTVGSTSEATAVANSSYFDIQITASPGSPLDLATLQFEVGKGGNDLDPRGFAVRSSVDGFNTNITSQTLPAGNIQAPALQVIDLSAQSAFQGLTAIDFHFYVWAQNPGVIPSIDFRNLQVNSVPEPSGVALLGLGLAGLAAYAGWRQIRCRAMTS